MAELVSERATTGPPPLAVTLLRQGRPKNQIRVALVLVAPALAEALGATLSACALLALTWACSAAAIYALNDVNDFREDAEAIARDPDDERAERPLHKRYPPDGEPALVPHQALRLGRVELGVALALCVAVGIVVHWASAALIVGYTVVNLWRTNHLVSDRETAGRSGLLIERGRAIDLLIVSAGFAARALSPLPAIPGVGPPIATYIAVFTGAVVISASKRLAKQQMRWSDLSLKEKERERARRSRLVWWVRIGAAGACVSYAVAAHGATEGSGPTRLATASATGMAAVLAVYGLRPRRNPIDVLKRPLERESSHGPDGEVLPQRPGPWRKWERAVVLPGTAVAFVTLWLALQASPI